MDHLWIYADILYRILLRILCNNQSLAITVCYRKRDTSITIILHATLGQYKWYHTLTTVLHVHVHHDQLRMQLGLKHSMMGHGERPGVSGGHFPEHGIVLQSLSLVASYYVSIAVRNCIISMKLPCKNDCQDTIGISQYSMKLILISFINRRFKNTIHLKHNNLMFPRI